VNSIGYNVKSLGVAFISVFEQVISPAFGPLLSSSGTNDVRARLAAVCLFDDCVQYCGPSAAAKYGPMLIQGAVQGITDADDDLRNASVYGISQIARHAPTTISDQMVGPIMDQLVRTVQSARGQPREELDYPGLVENAVSAMASIALFDSSPFAKSMSTGPERERLLGLFLDSLPLREVEMEARYCHAGLCELIEAGAVKADASARVVQIVGGILELVERGEEVATPATCFRLVGLIKRIQEVSGDMELRSALLSLTPEERAATDRAMKCHGDGSSSTAQCGGSPNSVSRLT